MRIAILSSGFPPTGGGGVSTAHFNLYVTLRKMGHEVRLVTFNDDITAPVPDDGSVERTGRLPHLLIEFCYKIFRFLFLRRKRGLEAFQCRDVMIGVVHGMFAFSKIKRFRPNMLIVPDHGAPSALFRRIPGCTTIFVSHHNAGRFVDEPLIALFSRRDAEWALKIEQKAVSNADVLVCPSRYMRDMVLNTYRFDGPIEVIPNITDLQLIEGIAVVDVRKEAGLPEDAPIVYIPSAGSPFKGTQFVFEIVRRVSMEYGKEIGFYLSGQLASPLRRALEFLPGNARVISPGRIPYQENIGRIKSTTLCVSPTLMENFSMAFAEAQVCGLPVISFDVGGNKDLIVDGFTGYLVPFMDLESMITKVSSLLADPERIREFRLAATKHMETLFEPEAIADKYVALVKGK